MIVSARIHSILGYFILFVCPPPTLPLKALYFVIALSPEFITVSDKKEVKAINYSKKM